MKPPRVLMVSGNAPPVMDGVGDFVLRLVQELARQRPDWSWFWLARRPRRVDWPITREGGVRLLRPNHTWTPRGRSLACAVARAVRPQIVHVQEQIHSFHETPAACEIARASGGAIVTTLHEYHTELPSVVFTNELVQMSRVVVSNDPRNAQRCLESTGRMPDHQWWSAATVCPLDPSRREPSRPGAVVTFGFVSALKTMGLLHEALKIVRLSHPELRWRIVGPFHPDTDPSHAALRDQLAPDLGWIELTGAVPGLDRVRPYLADAQLMLLPFTDGASLRRTTLQSAWALGLPVVTTPPPLETDAVIDGENCLLVRDSTPDAWASAIVRVLSDPSLADHLSAGSLRAADRYSWRRLAANYLAMYDALLETATKSGA